VSVVIVCYAKCTPCQFGEHPRDPHTWMESEDLEHAGMPTPSTEEAWLELDLSKPCGCHCNQRQAVPDDRA
jgi:hypothetical protein